MVALQLCQNKNALQSCLQCIFTARQRYLSIKHSWQDVEEFKRKGCTRDLFQEEVIPPLLFPLSMSVYISDRTVSELSVPPAVLRADVQHGHILQTRLKVVSLSPA